ncbi:aldo/keto reductase [Flavobacterium sp. RNTU_13]|uniref:aldo/keto reductase n=1 Tax=Flavobacterium sp. RNTU_13 TaxID=3375145 RepID=UPI003985B670
MEYRKIGNTDLELSVITFGAWAAGGWMWGGTERNEAIEAIQKSFDEGVTSIDTAPIYGQGDSEDIVAEAIAPLGRHKVQLVTKFGMRWDLAQGTLAMKSKNNQGQDIDIYKYAGRESIIKECEDSLRRLKTDYIDLYQIHWPDVTTPIQETFETVAELIQQGKVRYAGVCNYTAEQVAEASKYVNIVSDQVPYSMVKRDIEQELVPYVLDHGKSILAYSPLERGLLTGKMQPGHQFAEGDHRASVYFYKDENLKRVNEVLDKLRPMAEDKGATLAQLVLRWTVEQPGITIALAGARNAQQSVANAKALNIKLAKDEIAFINTLLADLHLVK